MCPSGNAGIQSPETPDRRVIAHRDDAWLCAESG